MSDVRSAPKRTIEDGKAVAMVLGLDLMKVNRDGFTLEPLGNGDWLVTWSGMAVLDAKAAAILFGDGDTRDHEGRTPHASGRLS